MCPQLALEHYGSGSEDFPGEAHDGPGEMAWGVAQRQRGSRPARSSPEAVGTESRHLHQAMGHRAEVGHPGRPPWGLLHTQVLPEGPGPGSLNLHWSGGQRARGRG